MYHGNDIGYSLDVGRNDIGYSLDVGCPMYHGNDIFLQKDEEVANVLVRFLLDYPQPYPSALP
jgi:hypothetical protein